MDTGIGIALIALIGTIISGAISWVANNRSNDTEETVAELERRWDREKLLKPERQAAYSKLFDFVNRALNDDYDVDEARDFLGELMIWGTDDIVKTFSRFMAKAKRGELDDVEAARALLEIHLYARQTFNPDSTITMDDIGYMYIAEWEQKYRKHITT